MRRVLWVGVVAVSVAASLALARTGVVKTRSGETYEGEITESADAITVKKGGIEAKVARADIVSVRFTDPNSAFTTRIKELKPDDIPGRIAIAREAFGVGDYATARQMAEQVLDKDPNNKQAVDLLSMIRRQIMLESRAKALEAAATQPTEPSAGAAPGALPPRYLSDSDINRVRQTELRDFDAARVRVRLDNNVVARYMELPQSQGADISTLSPFQQAMAIIHSSEPDLRKDVIILQDPVAIRDYRQYIQRIVLTGCASYGCHGSQAGGRFVLFNVPDNEAAAYTNFYLLASYQKKPATQPTNVFGGPVAGAKMIDRQAPERSLLLSYGLPQRLAGAHPHPDIPEFHSTFSSVDDPAYRRILAWIANGLVTQEPVYGIDYQPPIAKPAAKPTTKPAAPAAETPKK